MPSTRAMVPKAIEASARTSAPRGPQAAGDRTLHPLLRLQSAVGNQGVLRLLGAGVPQSKLAIGAPGDLYEQEAEQVAAEVTRTPTRPMVQRRCACGDASGRSGECTACRAKRLAQQHRPAEPVGPPFVPTFVGHVLHSSGRPLDAPTRAFFEPRFGRYLGAVQIHCDQAAGASAEGLNADAYTVGYDIVFAPGKYRPWSSDGRRLLAHELVHVVQQNGGPRVVQRQAKGATPGTAAPDEPLEVALEKQEKQALQEQELQNLGEILQRVEEHEEQQEEEEEPFFVKDNPRLVQLKAQLKEEKKRLPEELSSAQRSLTEAEKGYLKAEDQLSVLEDELNRLEHNRQLLESSAPLVAHAVAALKTGRAAAERDVEESRASINAISQYIEDKKNYIREKEHYLREMREQLKLQGLSAARRAGVSTETAVPGEPAALLQTTTLLQTMIEASPLLEPYVAAKRYINLRVPAKFKVEDPDAFEAAKKAHLSPAEAGSAGGFYDPKRDTIHLPQTAHFGEALHEAIHKYSARHLHNICNDPLNEGVTQYFADAVLQEQGLPKMARVTYQDKVDCATKLMRQFGFDGVARFYFLGEFGESLLHAAKMCDRYCD